jgi:hypothetical protein
VVLQAQPLLSSAFLSSSNLQQASSLLTGAPPQQPVVAAFFGASFLIGVFSKPIIVSASIVCFLMFTVMTEAE